MLFCQKSTEQALAETPDSPRALLYRVAFLRQKAALVTNPTTRAASLSEAERLYARILEIRLAPKKPAPSTSSNLSAAVFGEAFSETAKRLTPTRESLAFWPRPTSRFAVDPIYPAEARAAEKQPVRLEVIIDASGDVVNARILRSDPGLERGAMDAVSLRSWTPPQFHERAVAFIMTVAVSAPPNVRTGIRRF